MFAATRWAESQNEQVRNAGIGTLATMIQDALSGTPWNTVNWAVANLYRATRGKHDIFQRLMNTPDVALEDQRFLLNAVKALRQNDQAALRRLVSAPSSEESLSPNDPHYSQVSALWKAAASAERAR